MHLIWHIFKNHLLTVHLTVCRKYSIYKSRFFFLLFIFLVFPAFSPAVNHLYTVHELKSEVKPLLFLQTHSPPSISLQFNIAAVPVCTIQPAWVLISSWHILAALIISHHKVTWVLITGRVHFADTPSVGYQHIIHVNASINIIGHRRPCNSTLLSIAEWIIAYFRWDSVQ